MTGLPSRTTSVTTATRLSVIFEKSMYALRMLELMGFVTSRISVILIGETPLLWITSDTLCGNLPANGRGVLLHGESLSYGQCTHEDPQPHPCRARPGVL